MLKVAVLLAVVAVASAGYVHGVAGGVSTTSRAQDDFGNYRFNYRIVDPLGASNSRWEAGDAHGNQVGSYTIRDIDGRARNVNYVADGAGFRAKIHTNEQGTATSLPAAAVVASSQPGIPAVGPATVRIAHAAPVAHAPVAAIAHAPAIAAVAHGPAVGLAGGFGVGLGFGGHGIGHLGGHGLGHLGGYGLGHVGAYGGGFGGFKYIKGSGTHFRTTHCISFSSELKPSFSYSKMLKVAVLLAVVAVARAGFNHGIAGGVSTSSRAQDDFGNYRFNYRIVDPLGASNSRWEAGDAHGNQVGSYTIRDIDGRARNVNYVADGAGFRAKIHTNEQGTATSLPAAAVVASSQPGIPAVGPATVRIAHAAPVAHAPVAAIAHAPAVAAVAHGPAVGLAGGFGLGLGFGGHLGGHGLGYLGGYGLGHLGGLIHH
ncbi:fibroin heavy chain-like [Limulus polyphemus]|uniref:Fibroin heavy chain-like n=1 Tax=Limulus polyphemus TaxID=6850 RepID=A0ABM1B0Q0_LIMPO|nr:fibroin heavy chain-like [Limulus polyphemus]